MKRLKWLHKYISQMFGADSKSSNTHLSFEETQQLNIERRKKDKVDELLLENGFHNRRHSRDGFIYYVEDGRLCEIYWEMSGVQNYDILLAPVDLRKWQRPETLPIQQDKQLEILNKLRSWLKEQELRSDIDPPINIELANGRCAWKNCDQPKIKGSAYCPYHYDLNLLRQ